MSHLAEQRLARMRVDVDWLRSHLPRALTSLAAAVPDGRPTGGSGTSGGSGWGDGPTAGAALAGLDVRRQYSELDALAAEAQGLIALLVDAVEGVFDPGIDTDRLWRQHRCSGGEGEWANLLCTNLAVRTELVAPARRLPLCWACRKRFQRWCANGNTMIGRAARLAGA